MLVSRPVRPTDVKKVILKHEYSASGESKPSLANLEPEDGIRGDPERAGGPGGGSAARHPMDMRELANSTNLCSDEEHMQQKYEREQ